jgi:alkane 1-monooxygenase
LDLIAGKAGAPDSELESTVNPSLEIAQQEDVIGWRALLLHVPLQIAVIGFGAWLSARESVSGATWFALAAGVGLVTGGIGITIAHELIHRRNEALWWTGFGLLSSVGYAHYAIEHIIGHHASVGTPRDPASAPRGVTVLAFIPSSVIGQFRSAWQFEVAQLAKLKRPVWSIDNRVLLGLAASALIFTVCVAIAGIWGGLFWLAQAIGAVILLESINYIQHYGLSRSIDPLTGRPERIRDVHTWDSSELLSGAVLLGLPLHSDHHIHPQRSFLRLRPQRRAPQLPVGYPGALISAWVPPLWRRLTHPVLDRFDT